MGDLLRSLMACDRQSIAEARHARSWTLSCLLNQSTWLWTPKPAATVNDHENGDPSMLPLLVALRKI